MIFAWLVPRRGLPAQGRILHGRFGARELCPSGHLQQLSSRPGLGLRVTDTPGCLRHGLPSLPNMPIPKHPIWRLTTRWSRPGQPSGWIVRDTSLRLAGRLISRPLGGGARPCNGARNERPQVPQRPSHRHRWSHLATECSTAPSPPSPFSRRTLPSTLRHAPTHSYEYHFAIARRDIPLHARPSTRYRRAVARPPR